MSPIPQVAKISMDTGIPSAASTEIPVCSDRFITVYSLDPLADNRWDAFLERHPRASLFHTRAWLEALHGTYGYQPEVYTTSAPDTDLQNGIVFCRVESWLTGRRLVSLPFSDHCEPLVDTRADAETLFSALELEMTKERLRYFDLRSPADLDPDSSLARTTEEYCFHELDLRPHIDSIFGNFHKDSTQRKIRRAQREGLIYQEGQSEFLLEHFYRLFVEMRRRHGIPPQPQKWFRNLIASFGNALKIRVVFQGSRSVAGILTIQFKNRLTYKYGGSDTQYNNLGGMQLLFWRSICEAKEHGLQVFDLGRSDSGDTGLITFKDRWGATRSTLTYSRYFAPGYADASSRRANSGWRFEAAKRLFAHMPNVVLSAAGRILYKHVG